MSGDYQHALASFNTLAAAAPNETSKNLALEQAKIATNLAHEDAARHEQRETENIAPTPQELPPPDAHVVRAGARTLDELFELYGSTLTYGVVTGVLVDGGVSEKTSGNYDSHVAIPITMLSLGAVASLVITIADAKGALRYGVPQSISSGLHMGLEQGFFWALWDRSRESVPTPSYLHTAATVWGFTTAGAIAGGLVGGLAKVTPGQASWVGTISFWPAVILGSISLAATGRDGTLPNIVKGERNLGLVGGITGLAGLGVGVLTARWVKPSISRTRYIDLGSGLGGLFGGLLCVASNSRRGSECNEAGVFGGIAIGTGLGFISSMIVTQWLARNTAENSSPVLNAMRPSITPVAGGAIFGVSGSL